MNEVKDIKMAFLLNVFFAALELIGGIYTNSISIISDSIHDLGDAVAMVIALFLEKKSNRKPDKNYTFGYHRYSLLGALITSMILLASSSFIILNAIPRLFNPEKVDYNGMLVLAIAGMIINGYAAYKTSKSNNLNEKSINLHMLEDVLGWVAIFFGSIIIKITGFYIVDPLLSIGITSYILLKTLANLRKVVDIFLEKKPQDCDVDKIREEVLKIDGVKNVHHIHIWSMDNVKNYITMDVSVVKNISPEETEKIKQKIKNEMKTNNIEHSTIEIEFEI